MPVQQRRSLRRMLGVAGDLLEDVVVLLDEGTRRGADATARIVRRRGGSAANVAVTAAGLGASVRLITAVGDDPTGRSLVSEVEVAGVVVRAQVGERTGSVVVVVEPGGQRTMYPDRGAAGGLRLHTADVAGLELLHLTGYALLPALRSSAPGSLVDDLRRLDIARTIDVASVQVVEQLGDALVPLLRWLGPRVVLANEDEATALGWSPEHPPEDLDVVIKHGPGPAVLLSGGSVVTVPALPVGIVDDTTGAGDAFAAGYLVAVLAGHPAVEAIAAGHRSAARHLRRFPS